MNNNTIQTTLYYLKKHYLKKGQLLKKGIDTLITKKFF